MPTATNVVVSRRWRLPGDALPTPATSTRRSYRVSMPQMAVGGLSENWLLREFGDVHWESIAATHRRLPREIVDACGNRLYATFVRVRWEGNEPLGEFRENERLTLGGDLSRLGSSLFFSDLELCGEGKRIEASTMTVFVSRNGGRNRELRRGEPVGVPEGSVPEHDAMPAMGAGYRRVRDGVADTITLGGETFTPTDTPLFESSYTINPYHDINGVSLLYFAVYPVINDTCERDVAHAHPEAFGATDDWATDASTLARDVFYLGNCDARDTLTYHLCSIEPAGSNRLKLVSCLYRGSDGAKVAVVLTLKELNR